jgi:hypothetical protein
MNCASSIGSGGSVYTAGAGLAFDRDEVDLDQRRIDAAGRVWLKQCLFLGEPQPESAGPGRRPLFLSSTVWGQRSHDRI